MRRKKGFTLIELLIVVAIISILAAIAIPNFLEAQVRAKVARMKGDMYTVRTALESYRIDQNDYPPGPYAFAPPFPEVKTYLLSTPVSYLSGIPLDVFNAIPDPSPPGGAFGISGPYVGYVNDPMVNEVWLLLSYGPDHDFEFDEVHYDASNGTASNGDIYMVGALR